MNLYVLPRSSSRACIGKTNRSLMLHFLFVHILALCRKFALVIIDMEKHESVCSVDINMIHKRVNSVDTTFTLCEPSQMLRLKKVLFNK